MVSEINIKKQDYIPVFSTSFKATLSNIGESLGSAYSELFSRLSRRGEFPSGSPFALYHTIGFKERDIDVEACIPTAGILPDDGELKGRVLNGYLSASIVHIGSYESIGDSYIRLIDWIGANGYEPEGQWREIYLVGPNEVNNSSEYRTEITCSITESRTAGL